jgi:hypothetical protein
MLAAPRHDPMMTKSRRAHEQRRDRRPSTPGGWPGPGLLVGLLLLAAPGRAPAQVLTPAVEELIATAEREGALRVIVELKLDASGAAGRQAIIDAQDRVLAELAGTTHRVVRRFTTVPFLALEVSADALRRLAGSPLVAGIREDRALRPQDKPAAP